MTEFLYFPKFTKETLNSVIHFEDPEMVTESKASGKGIFFLSSHYSNWELTAFSYSKIFNEKLNIIAKIQASKGLNKKINEYRKLSGNEIIEIGFSLKTIFKKLSNNEIVCFLIDQSANPGYSTYINFFGKEVPAFSGPARFALRLRPVLFFGISIRDENYKYNIHFSKINYEDITQESDEAVKLLTQRMQDILEGWIRRYPEQWLWFHKRFKHMKN